MKQTHWSKHSPEDPVSVSVDSAREQTLGLGFQASSELHPHSLEKGSEPWDTTGKGPREHSCHPRAEGTPRQIGDLQPSAPWP